MATLEGCNDMNSVIRVRDLNQYHIGKKLTIVDHANEINVSGKLWCVTHSFDSDGYFAIGAEKQYYGKTNTVVNIGSFRDLNLSLDANVFLETEATEEDLLL